MYILKSTSKSGASSPSRSSPSQGESLSPETKQSISHLKMQLRKAHAGNLPMFPLKKRNVFIITQSYLVIFHYILLTLDKEVLS